MRLFSEKKKIYIETLGLFYEEDEPWVSIRWRESGKSWDFGRRQRVAVKLEDFNKKNTLEKIALVLAQRHKEDEKKFQEKVKEELRPGEYYEIDMDEAKELLKEQKED